MCHIDVVILFFGTLISTGNWYTENCETSLCHFFLMMTPEIANTGWVFRHKLNTFIIETFASLCVYTRSWSNITIFRTMAIPYISPITVNNMETMVICRQQTQLHHLHNPLLFQPSGGITAVAVYQKKHDHIIDKVGRYFRINICYCLPLHGMLSYLKRSYGVLRVVSRHSTHCMLWWYQWPLWKRKLTLV